MKKMIFLLATLLLLTGCSGGNPSTPTPAPGASNPSGQQEQSSTDSSKEEVYQLSFSAETLDGETVDQSIFQNAKLTMLNVWGTFCNPCIKEMPDLGALAAEGGEDYQILGLCADLDGSKEMLATAQEIVAQTGANYIHLQPNDSLSDILYASSAIPATFFFDSEGKLVGQGMLGAQTKETWAKEIQSRLDMVNANAAAES